MRNGTILKLQLTNFQIYESAEFIFSPYLNFIAAPNGSGKSTLTNALAFICLKTPKTLNKNCDLGQYVRFGCEKAIIEATFYYKTSNTTEMKLRREITTQNTSVFYLNNEKATRSKVNSFLVDCNIDVSNMTQFLPQEKVSEFARLSPEDLLLEVMDVVPDMNLRKTYDEINELETETLKLKDGLDVIDCKKIGTENAVSNLKDEIDKIEEKKVKEEKIENMKMKLKWIEYSDFVERKKEYEKRVEDNILRLKEVEVFIENTSQQIADVKSKSEIKDMASEYAKVDRYNKKIEIHNEKLKKNLKENEFLKSDLSRLNAKKESRENELEDEHIKIKELEKNMKKIKIQDLTKLEEELIKDIGTEITKYVGENPDFYGKILKKLKKFTTNHLNDKLALEYKKNSEDSNNITSSYLKTGVDEIKRLKIGNERIHDDVLPNNFDKNKGVDLNRILKIKTILESVVDKKNEEKRNQKRKKSEQDEENNKISKEFEKLENKKNLFSEFRKKRLDDLMKFSRDTYEAVVWLRCNKDMFKEEIIEPSYIHLKIKDPSFIVAVENLLSRNALIAFICKNSADFELFTKKIKEEKNLRVNVIEQAIRNPIPNGLINKNELLKLGFEGYALDFLELRHEYLQMFANMSHLHNIPVSKRKIDENSIFKKYDFKKMIVCDRYIEYRKSKYGNGDSTLIDSECKRKNMYHETTSEEEIKNIELKMQELNEKKRKNKEELKNILSIMNNIDSEITKLMKINDFLDKNYTEIEETEKRKKSMEKTLKKYHENYLKLQNDNSIEEEIKNKIIQINGKKGEIENCIIELEKETSNKEIYGILNSVAIKEVKIETYMKTISELENLKDYKIKEIEQVNKYLKCSQTELENVKYRLSEMKKELKGKNNQIFEQLPETKEELDREIRLNSMAITHLNIDKNALREHEMRTQSLKLINDEKKSIEEKIKIKNDDITSKREKLTLKIETLIEPVNKRFQDLFEKLNCKGKIEFEHKDLKCKKWKLNILVKFRKEEELQKLTSNRQSGGEKSVSTILFLLSLQNLSTSPFKLVDEINQGMDRYNEKMVSNLLIDICKEENSPQFFVITPKIVRGINFGEKMKTIIIYGSDNGNMQNQYISYVKNLTSD